MTTAVAVTRASLTLPDRSLEPRQQGRSLMRSVWFALLLVMGGLPLFPAATEAALSAQIPTVSRAPEISEFLERAAPPRFLRIDDFRQRQPTDGAPASLATTAYLGYGDAAVYVV